MFQPSRLVGTQLGDHMYIRSFLICALVVILMIIALPWVTGKIEQYGYAMMVFLGATIALAPSAAAQARRWLRS